jgi:hypothetical protein
MFKYFNPLWTFVLGSGATLIMTIFLPAIFTAQQELAINPQVTSGNYWMLSQTVTSIRLIIFIVCFMLTLYFTAKAWLARKN